MSELETELLEALKALLKACEDDQDGPTVSSEMFEARRTAAQLIAENEGAT